MRCSFCVLLLMMLIAVQAQPSESSSSSSAYIHPTAGHRPPLTNEDAEFFLLDKFSDFGPILPALGVKSTETETQEHHKNVKTSATKDYDKSASQSSKEVTHSSKDDDGYSESRKFTNQSSSRERIVEDQKYESDESSTVVKKRKTSLLDLGGLVSIGTEHKKTTKIDDRETTDKKIETEIKKDSKTTEESRKSERDGVKGYSAESSESRQTTDTTSKSVKEKQSSTSSKSIAEQEEDKLSINILGVDLSQSNTRKKDKTIYKKKESDKESLSTDTKTTNSAKSSKYSDDGNTVKSLKTQSNCGTASSSKSEKANASETVGETETTSETESDSKSSIKGKKNPSPLMFF